MTAVGADPKATPSAPTAADRASSRGWFTALLRRLHFFAGLLVGPFILVAAVSGALYAITPTLESTLYAHELTASSTAPAVPLAEQVSAAEQYVGGGATPVAVRPAPQAGATTRVMFADDTLPESTTRAIFVERLSGRRPPFSSPSPATGVASVSGSVLSGALTSPPRR